jgi:hypothetical protein
MKQALNDSSIDFRLWVGVFLASALASFGCDNNINVTEPHLPGAEVGSEAIVVVGTMSSQQGTCNEATLLFDREELEGARTECAEPSGCTQLELESDFFVTRAGTHTVAFKVLSQSDSFQEYTIEGEVMAPLNPYNRIQLGPVTTTLSPGDKYTFRIDRLPWLRPLPPRPDDS